MCSRRAELSRRFRCSVSLKTGEAFGVSDRRLPSKRPEPQGSPWAPTWMRASAQSTSSPFIQIFSVSRIQPPPVSGRMVRGLLDDVHRTRAREAKELGRSEGRHVPLRAGTDPEDALRKEHPLD